MPESSKAVEAAKSLNTEGKRQEEVFESNKKQKKNDAEGAGVTVKEEVGGKKNLKKKKMKTRQDYRLQFFNMLVDYYSCDDDSDTEFTVRYADEVSDHDEEEEYDDDDDDEESVDDDAEALEEKNDHDMHGHSVRLDSASENGDSKDAKSSQEKRSCVNVQGLDKSIEENDALEEKNDHDLQGCSVRRDSASEKGAYTSQSNSKDAKRSQEKGFGVNIIHVRGFDKSIKQNDIKKVLREHFSGCGEVIGIYVPPGKDADVKGFAFIEFMNNDAVTSALELDQSSLDGYILTVEETKVIDVGVVV